MATVDDKYSIDHVEAGGDDYKHQITQEEVKHGDNALKYLGDERVEVTEEDVSCEFPYNDPVVIMF